MSHQDYPASTTNTIHLSTRKKRRGMIEKRRRDKINSSLSELRRLVPAAFEKEGSAKLEKAEILQMTVDYLRMLHERGLAGSLTTSVKPEADPLGTETPSSTPISSSSFMIGQQVAGQHHHSQHQQHHSQHQQHHLSAAAANSQTPQSVQPTSQLSSPPHEPASSAAAAAAAASAATTQAAVASASMTAASMSAAAAAAAAAVQQHQQQQLHQHLTQTHHGALAAQQHHHHNQIQQFNYSHHHHNELAQSPILEQFYNQHHPSAGHNHSRATMQQLHHQPYAANCYNPSY